MLTGKWNSKMDNIVIAFAGQIGSGKSTVSIALAEALGFSRAGFGDYVRYVAAQRGLTADREVLQTIGNGLIEQGWDSFCEAVLSQANWMKGEAVVIDGIRHIEAIQTLLRITDPSKFILIFISINEADRKNRLFGKGIHEEEKQIRIDSHSTEIQVNSLKNKADLILDGTRPISELVNQVIEFIT
jgi:dephospho-CoA kinase